MRREKVCLLSTRLNYTLLTHSFTVQPVWVMIVQSRQRLLLAIVWCCCWQTRQSYWALVSEAIARRQNQRARRSAEITLQSPSTYRLVPTTHQAVWLNGWSTRVAGLRFRLIDWCLPGCHQWAYIRDCRQWVPRNRLLLIPTLTVEPCSSALHGAPCHPLFLAMRRRLYNAIIMAVHWATTL